jgi:hypothetical protein
MRALEPKGLYQWKTPISQRIGDTLLILILFPIMIASLSFLLSILMFLILMVLGMNEDEWFRPGVISSIGVGLIMSFVLVHRRLCWEIRLEGDQIFLGVASLGRRIPCSWVKFIRADDVIRAREVHFLRRGAIPLRLEVDWLHRATIWLGPEDAKDCLKALQQLCRKASVVDPDGREYLPLDQAAVPAGKIRLGRFYLTSGMIGLIMGALVLFFLLLLTLDFLQGKRGWQDFNQIGELWLSVPAALAGSWYSMRKGYGYLRGS